MVTLVVHGRQPRRLLGELGWRGGLSVAVSLCGTVLSCLLGPPLLLAVAVEGWRGVLFRAETPLRWLVVAAAAARRWPPAARRRSGPALLGRRSAWGGSTSRAGSLTAAALPAAGLGGGVARPLRAVARPAGVEQDGSRAGVPPRRPDDSRLTPRSASVRPPARVRSPGVPSGPATFRRAPSNGPSADGAAHNQSGDGEPEATVSRPAPAQPPSRSMCRMIVARVAVAFTTGIEPDDESVKGPFDASTSRR